MEYLLKYGRLENLTIYFFDYAMPFINKAIEKCTKGCILFFSKKGNIRITKNYRGIIAMTAKVYNVLLLNHVWHELKKTFRKNQNSFCRNWSTSQILIICQIIKGVLAKNIKATLLFIDSSKTFHSIYRGKME